MNHFLKNKEMNEMYASYGIMNFATGLISIFVPIYLYKLGYSIPHILFFFFLSAVGFLLFLRVGIGAVSRFGVKHSMLLAVPFLIAYFIGLRFLPDYPFLFSVLPFFIALKMDLYNFAFHLNVVEHADRKTTGQQVALIQTSALIAGALAPLIGGIIAKNFSFDALFVVSSVLLFAAILPLFMTHDTKEPPHFGTKTIFKDFFKRNRFPSIVSFSGYAIESWVGSIIWPIFLSLILAGVESVGAIFSITMIITVIALYVSGSRTDTRDKRALLKTNTFFHSVGWVGRLFVNNFLVASLVDAYKNLAFQSLWVPWSSYCYDIARKTDYFRFIVEREVTFNTARVIFIPLLIAVFVIGYHPFYVSFIIATLFSLFYSVLARQSPEADMYSAN